MRGNSGKTDADRIDRRAGAMIWRSALSVLMIIILLMAIMPVQAGIAPNNTGISNSSVSIYIIVFNDTPQHMAMAQSTSNLIESYGGQVKYRYSLINGMAVTLPDDMVGQLASLPNVKYIEKDQEVHVLLNDSISMIGADLAWDEGYTGTGVKVAVLDTGVDATHHDLNGGKVILWKDFSGKNYATPHDGHGHGTHVSSIIAGTGNASGGNFTGVAPNASLIEGKVLDDSGSGNYDDIIAGMEWAVDNGAQVISMSLGGSHSQSMDDAVANATSHGVVVVVAAGNSGSAPRTIECPGDAPTAITVGAVDKSDVIASFSSRGPNRDGSIKPDVTNVGVNVWAAKAAGTNLNTGTQYYLPMNGTSMATPMTSGVVALMLERAPYLTPAHVKKILETTAKPMGTGLPNNVYGWGRVQAKYAVDNVSYSAIYVSDNLPVSPGTILDTTPITITMQNDGAYNWSNANNVTIHALDDAATIGEAITSMPPGVNITLGHQYTWTLNLNTPVPSGTYQLKYQLFANNTPFGDTLSKTIRVNDSVEPGMLQFNNSSYNALRTSGSAIIRVNRTDGLDNIVTVNYMTGGENATAGKDYQATSGTLTFVQDLQNASFNVSILNDGVYRGVNKTVQLSLSNPTGGASLGLSSANITIIDNNPQPVLQFSASDYIAFENQTNYTITVTRTANSHGPVSVNYSVGGGNATPGLDYMPVNGKLNFKDGETSKSFNVTVLDDHTVGPDRSVNITLSNSTNGSILGARASAVLTIKESAIYFTYHLNKGWNLVSVPLNVSNNSFDSFFPVDVKSHVVVVWAYSGVAEGWKFYTPQPGYDPNTLTAVDTWHGYWIKVDQDVSFTISGTAGNGTALHQGWNLVGYPSLTVGVPAEAYPGAFVVWEYKNGQWYFYTPKSGYDPNTLTGMEPGYGYWVKVT